jgi:hypothetical protein
VLGLAWALPALAPSVLSTPRHAYEQMDVAARWSDDILLNNASKLKVGTTNAERLFSPKLSPFFESAVSSFAS